MSVDRLFLADETDVFIMRTDPNPDVVLSVLDSHGAKIKTYSRRPLFTDFLEMKRRMPGILPK
jgi:hypothetical protein